MGPDAQQIAIDVGDGSVSALWSAPPHPVAVCVHGHGSRLPMTDGFNATVAAALFAAGIATLRYNLPYMDRGMPYPDPMDLAMATVAAAFRTATTLAPTLPVFVGGKSHGGRMASNAAALRLLPGVQGVYFFAFPLLEPTPPLWRRADHLVDVPAPLLFLQGTRDTSAPLRALRSTMNRLGSRATLQYFPGADHGFQLPGVPGIGNPEVMRPALATLVRWIGRIASARASIAEKPAAPPAARESKVA